MEAFKEQQDLAEHWRKEAEFYSGLFDNATLSTKHMTETLQLYRNLLKKAKINYL